MNPPRVARLLARVFAHPEDRVFVLADLDERFRALAAEVGPRPARRWYWSQVLRGASWALLPDPGALRSAMRSGLAGEVRLAARTLRRRPAYAAGAVLTLALGLGAAALLAAVAWHVWLAPLPFPDPERLVRVYETPPLENAFAVERRSLSPPLLEDLRTHDWETIEGVAGVSSDQLEWTRRGETRRLAALAVSPELLPMLGVAPEAGRLLEEDARAREVLLAEPFWHSALGGDVSALGTTMMLSGEPHRIVGVVRLPAVYPGDADVVVPLAFGDEELGEGMRGARYLDAIARVRAAHDVSEARSELDAFVVALATDHPAHRGWGGDAVTLRDDLLRPFRGVLSLLLAAGGAFLALAAVNVAGLVGARWVDARHERAVRRALGASEARLLRSCVVETGVIAVTGAALGLLGAVWLVTPIRSLVPADVPRLAEVQLGAAQAVAVVAAGVVLGGLVGLLGHLLARRTTGAATGGRRTSAAGLGGRRALVTGQIALTTLLTTGGVAILRHASQLRAVDVGFDAEAVSVTHLSLSESRHPAAEVQWEAWASLLEGLRARGVIAAVATNLPMSGSSWPFGYRMDAASEQGFAQYHAVSPAYFEVMGIRIVAGRALSADDVASGPPVVVVDEAFVREAFGGEEAVGRSVEVVGVERAIVGVVAATRHAGPGTEPPVQLYVPMAQDPWAFASLLLPSSRSDAGVVAADVASRLDPDLVVPPAVPYVDFLSAWYAPLRLQLVLIGALALLGLALATFGLYAVVAYHVSTRRHEIGIRMALGAGGGRVFGGVVGHGAAMAVAGGALGLGAWHLLLPWTEGLVAGVGRPDAIVTMLVVGVVGGSCLLATLAPARRSTTVDPAVTLRSE